MAHDGGVQQVLLIIEVRGLGLKADTCVQAEVTDLIAEHDIGIVVVLVVGRVLRVLYIEKPCEKFIAGFVAEDEGFNDFITRHISPEIAVFLLGEQRVDTVHGAIAVREATLELVAELQVSTLEQRLGVGGTNAPVPTLRRIVRILVCEGLRGTAVLIVINE